MAASAPGRLTHRASVKAVPAARADVTARINASTAKAPLEARS
jgi:hypothetical protein